MTTTPNRFSRLKLVGWRQFGDVEIDLHPTLTVITGANGAGKSTLLNVFSAHFGYQRPYLSTPLRDSESGGYRYLTGVVDFFRRVFSSSTNAAANQQQVGEITYSNGQRGTAQVPRKEGIQYSLSIAGQQPVSGFHVPSHRRLATYQQVGQIPTQPMLPQQAYDQFNAEIVNVYQGGHTGYSSTYRIKEALLSMAVFGPGTKYVQRNDVLLRVFEGFVETLRKVLPEEIGFIDISIRSPDVVMVTRSGDFLIDSASGGVMALVDIAWQIYMFSLRSSSFVVTIDEPENHLHPSMQRTLMGNLIKTFPNVQFIVATHSPFIVSAVKDARVYVLRYEQKPDGGLSEASPQQTRYVTSVRLDAVNRAATASQLLRDVLGLPTTYPEWVADGLRDIVHRYKEQPISEATLKALRQELQTAGYEELYPDAVTSLVKQ